MKKSLLALAILGTLMSSFSLSLADIPGRDPQTAEKDWQYKTLNVQGFHNIVGETDTVILQRNESSNYIVNIPKVPASIHTRNYVNKETGHTIKTVSAVQVDGLRYVIETKNAEDYKVGHPYFDKPFESLTDKELFDVGYEKQVHKYDNDPRGFTRTITAGKLIKSGPEKPVWDLYVYPEKQCNDILPSFREASYVDAYSRPESMGGLNYRVPNDFKFVSDTVDEKGVRIIIYANPKHPDTDLFMVRLNDNHFKVDYRNDYPIYLYARMMDKFLEEKRPMDKAEIVFANNLVGTYISYTGRKTEIYRRYLDIYVPNQTYMHRIGFDTKEYHPEYEQIMRDITMSVSVQNSETGETHNWLQWPNLLEQIDHRKK